MSAVTVTDEPRERCDSQLQSRRWWIGGLAGRVPAFTFSGYKPTRVSAKIL